MPPDSEDWIVLTTDALSATELIAWATTPGSGAVVSFSGVVRDHAEGRDDVHAMTYEAYEGPARARMAEIIAEARLRWPEVERAALHHRIGRLELSEPSVVVVVSSPHRDVAFEAARFAIDTLKEAVPIWKQEHFAGESAWGLGAHDVRAVRGN